MARSRRRTRRRYRHTARPAAWRRPPGLTTAPDSRAEPDPPGDRGAMRHHHQWRRTQAVVREVMLGEPGDRVAELVGHLRLLGDLAEHLRGRLARLARPHQIEYPELHRLASGREWDGSVARYFSGARRRRPAGRDRTAPDFAGAR